MEEIRATVDSEKEWWEKRRASIQKDFMKELDEAEKPTPSSSAPSVSGAKSVTSEDSEAVLVDTNTPSATPSSKKKKGKK